MTPKKKQTLLIFILMPFLLSTEILYAQEYQSINAIQTAITEFIEANIDTTQDYEIQVNNLDRRLKLANCSVPLDTYSHDKKIEAGILSIGVSCNGEQKWSLFHSAKLTTYINVLALKQALKRNTVISQNNIVLVKKSTAKLHHGYFTNYQQIKNQLTTRNLRAGDTLQPSHLTHPQLIKKGEQVTIHAFSPSFSIKMSGKALMSGSLGEKIQAKNNTSKKVVEGTITKAGTISVNY
ncbi:MAG: flagellar basal body P-ring formation chaperone FlgA [Methyloprofundus sp.]|nr:flagellar basal body P-ring formation chaperone FlgA [Methyloprofundus sp.]MDT8425562.1 flagellar basal body P-ring formation chaperone FlgA [Methyloprofundus sp.]